jgi:protein kinase
MYRICRVLGTRTVDSWADGIHLARTNQFPKFDSVQLAALIPSASEDAINLFSMLCPWNPCNRPPAEEALKHPFFRSCFYTPFLRFRTTANRAILSARTSGESEQKCDGRYHGALSNSSLDYSFPFPNMLQACSRTIVHCNFNRANNRDVSSPAKQFRFEPQSINMGRTAVR